MLRHSISQIFSTSSPHSQSQQLQLRTPTNDQMFPLLQPSRPKISSPNSSKLSYMDKRPNRSSISSSPSFSQIQALPSNSAPLPTPTSYQLEQARLLEDCQRQHELLRDASRRHPVFFTERFKKLPNGIVTGTSNPISTGYMYEDGLGRRDENARL